MERMEYSRKNGSCQDETPLGRLIHDIQGVLLIFCIKIL